jgi:trehalose 6-phosphate phosphatase
MDTALPRPPRAILDGASLFLDLDGTLLDLRDRPEDVIADESLRSLLTGLAAKFENRLAVVSGRSLAQIDAILGDVAQNLAASGSHGCEHRWQGVCARPERPEALDTAASHMRRFAQRHDGVLVEEKSYGAALHYRMQPTAEQEARALVERLSEDLNLVVQNGKMVSELRLGGSDKGTVVRRLMARPPMAGSRPVFIGDDLTDEPGFVAAQEGGGAGILIGAPRQTAATYALPDPAALRGWLAEAVR